MMLLQPPGPGVSDITPAIVAALQDQTGPYAQFSQICLAVIDGLGVDLLNAARAYTPFFRTHPGAVIETVQPATTAAATTSILTGKLPRETGVLGYRMRLDAGVTSLIKWANYSDSFAAAATYQPQPTIFELLGGGIAATNPAFANSGLTGANLRGATIRGTKAFSGRVNAAIDALKAGEKFVYLYCEDVDHIGHGHGPLSQPWIEALENTDRELKRLAVNLPKDTLLLITADHGMIQAGASHNIRAWRYGDKVYECAGCVRVLQLFASGANGAQVSADQIAKGQELYHLAKQDLQGWGELADRTETAKAWGMSVADARVPDVLITASGTSRLVDPQMMPEAEMQMPGIHGANTPAELRVPLIAVAP